MKKEKILLVTSMLRYDRLLCFLFWNKVFVHLMVLMMLYSEICQSTVPCVLMFILVVEGQVPELISAI